MTDSKSEDTLEEEFLEEEESKSESKSESKGESLSPTSEASSVSSTQTKSQASKSGSRIQRNAPRRSIFKSLSSDHINYFEGRFRSEDEFTAEERSSIINNEKLIRQLEIISQRFEIDEIDRRRAELTQSSGDSSSLEKSSFIKTTDDIYGYSSTIDSSEREITPADDTELLILPPDHPLMKRFQTTYKTHLEKMKEKQNLELVSMKATLKEAEKTFENEGEELYTTQQELSKCQSQLELLHKDWHAFLEDRKSMQEQTLTNRKQHQDELENVQELEKKLMTYRTEISKWDLLINLMTQMKEEMRSDVSALRRAAENVDGTLNKLQIEKHEQDIAVKKKTEELIRMQDMLEMYKKHRTSQEDELTKARLNLAESQMRIECIELEKRHVFQQWKHTLSQLEQKDEAIKTLYESLTSLLNESFSRSTDINNLKKEIDKEMELNETLNMAKTRTERLIFRVEEDIKKCDKKSIKIKEELAFKFKILEVTESSFNDTNKTIQEIKRSDEINRKELDVTVSKRVALEDQLSEVYLSQMTSEKAVAHSEKTTAKLGKNVQHMEATLVKLENDLAHLVLEHTNTNIKCQKLSEEVKERNKEVEEFSDSAKGLEDLISKNNGTITNKQALMNQLIGKLDQFIEETGGDVTPLETRIRNLEKNIEQKTNEMQKLKISWLNRQTELVFLTHERDNVTAATIKLGRQYTIFSEKKRRMDNSVDEQKREIRRIEMSFNSLQHTISKLSENIYHEKGSEGNLLTEKTLAENKIARSLKEAELETIQFQAKLDAMKEEKKQLEVQLVDSRQQILLWEKKTELAKESKALVASEEISGEMQAMKWDIHRMQNRYLQLKRQQEIMMQETEKLISRRETILSKSENQAKSGKKPLTKTSIQKAIEELRNKLRASIKERHNFEEEITQLEQRRDSLNSQKENLSMLIRDLQKQTEGLEKSIEQTERHYQKNFQQLLALQQRAKYFQSFKEKKYTTLCKVESQVKDEVFKSWTVAQKLQEIVTYLSQKFPEFKSALLDLASRHEGRIASVEIDVVI